MLDMVPTLEAFCRFQRWVILRLVNLFWRCLGMRGSVCSVPSFKGVGSLLSPGTRKLRGHLMGDAL